jgi:branched-chain amino acid transport system permease protein
MPAPGPLRRRPPIRVILLTAIAATVLGAMALGSLATLSEGRLDAQDWRSLVVGGVARGSAYAVIAVGYTLVYGVLFMINFAHGEVFMAGAFSTLFVARTLSRTGILNAEPVLSIGILFASSMTISMVVSVILERVAYRPLRNSPRLILLITSIGASLFLQGTFFGFFGPSSVAYPEFDILQGTLFGGFITVKQLLVVVGAVVLMVGLQVFIQRTRTGRAMRAVGEDREIAALMGIDVDRVIVITFAISGALAGAAGILFVFLFNQVRFFMGTLPGIKAFTAAILGGIGSVIGAGLGGLILGVIENVGPVLFLSGSSVPAPNQLQPVITFGILVLVLIFRPGGILAPADQSTG